MNQTIHNWINTIGILVVVIVVLVSGNANQFGGTTNFDALTLDDGDLTISSGNASITGTLTATGNTTIDTTTFVVDASGNEVGVGTSSPASIFQVSSAPAGDGTNASTTVTFGAATSTSRAQFEMRQTDGGVSCVFVDAAGTSVVAIDGACN